MQEDTQENRTIGKYRISGILGRGSMGVVYKGRDPEIGRFVAVKTLRKIVSDSSEESERALERFRIEARSAGNLRHSNIITIFEVNRDGDTPYIVMDYVDGEGLDAVLSRSGRLDSATAIHYLAQIASGLDYAHSRGVIHRDIKPSNILVDKGGNVFILDFGVASINQSYGITESPKTANLVMGTPGYMSPEQILNKDLDHRSDLFALAVMAFECFTGHRAFSGEDFTSVMGSILNDKPASLTSLMPEYPLSLEAEFEKALSKRRENRFDSAQEMVFAFRQSLGVEGTAFRPQVSAHDVSARLRKPSSWRAFANPWQQTQVDSSLKPFGDMGGGNEKDQHDEVWGLMAQRGLSKPSSSSGQVSPGAMFRYQPEPPKYSGRSRYLDVKTLTACIGFMCVLLMFTLVWLLLKNDPQTLPPVSAGSRSGPPVEGTYTGGVGAIEPLTLESFAGDGGSHGKEIHELSERELIAIIVNPDSTEIRILEALKEAQQRSLPSLVDASVAPLKSDSHVVRIETIKILAEIGDKRIVPELILSLDDHDPLVRGHAARALGVLGDRRALGYLSNLLIREDSEELKVVIETAMSRIRGF